MLNKILNIKNKEEKNRQYMFDLIKTVYNNYQVVSDIKKPLLQAASDLEKGKKVTFVAAQLNPSLPTRLMVDKENPKEYDELIQYTLKKSNRYFLFFNLTRVGLFR